MPGRIMSVGTGTPVGRERRLDVPLILWQSRDGASIFVVEFDPQSLKIGTLVLRPLGLGNGDDAVLSEQPCDRDLRS